MEKFEQLLSSARLNTYRRIFPEKPMELYLFNLKLAESFGTPISLFEVCFRNRIDQVLSDNIDPNWLNNSFFRK